MKNRKAHFALTVQATVVMGLSVPVSAEVHHYEIQPGGEYVFSPSPLSAFFLIYDCARLDNGCQFAVGGSFDLEFDESADEVIVADANLLLQGNDEVQESSYSTMVTSDGVSDWFTRLTFALISQEDTTFRYVEKNNSFMTLTRFADGSVNISGGFDNTFADGLGMDFQVTALTVPEISHCASIVWLVAAAVARWRSRQSIQLSLQSSRIERKYRGS